MIEDKWFANLAPRAIAALLSHDREEIERTERLMQARVAAGALAAARAGDDGVLAWAVRQGEFAAQSKSQLFQDLWVVDRTHRKRGGFFVEFGATDGVRHSNTWLLETVFDWTGILAEPNPVFHDDLSRNRAAVIDRRAVFSRTGERMSLRCASEPALSRLEDVAPDDRQEESGIRALVHHVDVETVSLGDLLVQASAPRDIDYVSIDTEGSELEILQAFDFDAWRVRRFSIEHNFTPRRREIYELMTSRGYVRMWSELSQIDDWYERAE